MRKKERLSKERMDIYRSIKRDSFDEKDYRDACKAALIACDFKDADLITKSAEKLVAHVKAKSPRIPMSVEGAMEILAAIGRQLIFMDGVEAVHSLDGDQNDTTGSRN